MGYECVVVWEGVVVFIVDRRLFVYLVGRDRGCEVFVSAAGSEV